MCWSNLMNCAEFALTRSTFLAQNEPYVVWWPASAPTRWGSLSTPLNPLTVAERGGNKGREKEKVRRKREWREGRKGKGKQLRIRRSFQKSTPVELPLLWGKPIPRCKSPVYQDNIIKICSNFAIGAWLHGPLLCERLILRRVFSHPPVQFSHGTQSGYQSVTLPHCCMSSLFM